MTDTPRGPESRARIPGGVVALGLVSLFMDVSSEMIHAVLPLFLTSTLGMGTAALGLVEGVAEATASIAKVVGGVASDRVGRRKPLVLFGYGLSAATKPLFALAGGAGLVVFARFADRVGKGIRGAPRDALVADLTPPEVRGAAYGLRQSLDTVGAFAGPLAAIALVLASGGAFRLVFAAAVLPAVASVALIVLGVSEPDRRTAASGAVPRVADVARLGRRFWFAVGLGALSTLARFSEAFLLLRARDAGVATAWVPLVLVAMNACYAASAYPLGRLSDGGRRRILAWGMGLLVAADAVLAVAQSPAAVLAGAGLWGLHMGATQGLFSAIVAGAAPLELRATAFGVFHLVTGVALLAASALAGLLWNLFGPAATFAAGGLLAALAWVGLAVGAGRRGTVPPPAAA